MFAFLKFTKCLFTDGIHGWMVGISIVSFTFPHTFFVCTTCTFVHTYIDNKTLPPTFLWVSKFDVKLGLWETIFSKLLYVREFSNILFQTCHFFFLFLVELSHFLKTSKTFFAMKNWKKMVPNLFPFLDLYWIYPFFNSQERDERAPSARFDVN